MSTNTDTVTLAKYANLAPADAPDVDIAFEKRLIDGIKPIAKHFLASALHHLFNTGLYDQLSKTGSSTFDELAEQLDMDFDRLRGFLLYLANEDIVTVQSGRVDLTLRARKFAEFRAWYTMLIGGYSTTLDQIGEALKKGSDSCTRNGQYVGLGSCEISQYDGMPITRSLLHRMNVHPRTMLDLGCGNGLYLVDFCREMPGITAWGAEPDSGSFCKAHSLITETGMSQRIHLSNVGATEFLANPPRECQPDVVVFGFVFQELLAQVGEDSVIELLQTTVAKFPRINIVVIEVIDEIENPSAMRHGLARNFWNNYYLIHYFTNQRLENRQFWEDLFHRASLTLCDAVTTPISVDSTGLEIGYLLRGPRFT